ncbi:MAG TPA: MFS transporter [Stellaceae bacterium]|nr:MFS transporter [Stellaceae bacterium]
MPSDAAALAGAGERSRRGRGGERGREMHVIAVVSAAHFVQHFQTLVLPPLFPFLKTQLGIGFVELGFALTVSSVVAVASQLPIGFLVDRVGSRRMLLCGLMVSALAFISFALSPSYPRLLLAMAFVGLSSSVFHPADYAILSALIPPARVGRAFSVHTFTGFIGTAAAPAVLLPVAASFGLRSAILTVSAVAIVAALPLLASRGVDNRQALAAGAPPPAEKKLGLTGILTPTIVFLTGFFALLSLSGSGISNFSVVALRGAFDTPLSTASLALTAYLLMQALGVLAGGFIADKTRRHGEVASIGYAVNACIVLAIGTLGLPAVPLLAAMGTAGLLGGLIMPSRDMLVRAAAPPGAVGRTFGVVTSGFSMGGMVGPLLFGFIMDHHAPRWVFGASVVIMATVAGVALVADRRTARKRALAAAE